MACAGGEVRASSVPKCEPGSHRIRAYSDTIQRALGVAELAGITRVADLTGLDHIGIPVAAAYRPNARSVSVSQGKGRTLEAAKASALMEALEGFFAERALRPLRLATAREMLASAEVAPLERLPRTRSPFSLDAKLLWVELDEWGTGRRCWVPMETVFIDFTRPALGCSGAFLMSSNGLASGNHPLEALSHGICELIERDANTLWSLATPGFRASRRLALDSIHDVANRELLARLDAAEVEVAIWEATTDVGVACFRCELADRRHRFMPLPPVHGSGCHTSREQALSRAITEAAQGRITRIAAVREDLDDSLYSPDVALEELRACALRFAISGGTRSFEEAPTFESDDVAADVSWLYKQLEQAGLGRVLWVELAPPNIGLHVARVIVPGLEAMLEVPHYRPGERAENWKQRQSL